MYTTNFQCVCVCVCVRECVYLWMYKNIYQKRVRYLCKHPLYTFKTYTDVLNKAKLFTECITKEVLMAWTLLSFTQTELYSREALENLSHPLKDYNSLNTWCQFVSTNRKILTIYTLHFKKTTTKQKKINAGLNFDRQRRKVIRWYFKSCFLSIEKCCSFLFCK